MSSDALLGFKRVSELWWGAAGVGGDEPLLPFWVKQEKERCQVSELKNEVAGLKTEIAGLKDKVDSLDRKVTQMSEIIDEMNHTLHSIL